MLARSGPVCARAGLALTIRDGIAGVRAGGTCAVSVENWNRDTSVGVDGAGRKVVLACRDMGLAESSSAVPGVGG